MAASCVACSLGRQTADHMPLQMHKRHRLTAAEAQQQEAEARRFAREKEKEYKLPKVFYATRTHSQIAQVRQCLSCLQGVQTAVRLRTARVPDARAPSIYFDCHMAGTQVPDKAHSSLHEGGVCCSQEMELGWQTLTLLAESSMHKIVCGPKTSCS